MEKSIKRMKMLACACLSLTFLSASALAQSTLTFTTFNIEWYGLNGDLDNELGSETRTGSIRKFLDSENAWADVMAFEEIVDVELLQTQLMPSSYGCASYRHDYDKHQHVVICVKSPLRIAMASDDDNYTLENVALGKHRPAVHGIVTAADGQPLVHVLAVHLKAMPNESAKRKQQVTHIADYLSRRDNDYPLVLLGDWNTFDNDTDDFTDIFAKAGLDLDLVPLDGTYTWRRSNNAKGSTFDRYWAQGLAPVGTAKVLGPCNLPHTRRTEILRYNDSVSDHCAVKATFRR